MTSTERSATTGVPAGSDSSVLDEAFERMAASSAFDLPNGFVNHGPMGCEALEALGLDDQIDAWARRFARVPGPAVEPIATATFDWQEALGNDARLPEWIGHIRGAIEGEGWPRVVEVWVPRLMPALSVRLFHGAIHVAHAVRALTVADTAPRRAELARAIGYWGARFYTGPRATEPEGPRGELRMAVTRAAADGARRYLADPSILNLHGVTGAMAVELLVDHISPDAGADALAQVHADHAALYAGTDPVTDVQVTGVAEIELAVTAEASGDVHQVKLVEACRRGLAITGDPVFSAAAETVTGSDVRPL